MEKLEKKRFEVLEQVNGCSVLIMSTRKAQMARAEVEAMLSQALRKLADAVAVESPNHRVLVNAIDSVKKKYDGFVKKHVALVIESGATMSHPDHKSYLDQVSDAYHRGMEAAESVLSTLEPSQDESTARGSDSIKLDLQLLTLTIVAQVAELERVAATEMSIEGHESCMAEVEVITDEIQSNYRSLMDELKSVEPGASMEDHSRFIVENLPKLKTIRVQLLSKKPSNQSQRRSTAAIGGTASEAANVVNQVTHGGGIKAAKLAAISAPKFSGKAQDYAEFKSKFQSMVEGHYDSATQLVYLQDGLPQKVKEEMNLRRKTVEQIWSSLDNWYGDPEVQLKESMADMYELEHVKLSSNKMIRKLILRRGSKHLE